VQFGQDSFGGGYTDTMMHPLVAIAVIVATALVLVLPRKYAAVPFLLVVFLTPAGQELYIGGAHLYVLRLIIPFGLARGVIASLFSKSEFLPGGLNFLDKLFTCWAIFRAMALILLFHGDRAAMTNQVAFLWDVLGAYFLLRFLIRDEEDIARVAKTFAVVVGILAITMLNEKVRDQNVFGYLGGPPIVDQIREGKIRAQGTFEHPILAGTFAATLLPLFLWLWQSHRSRNGAVVGAIGSTIMVITSASSTPLLGYLAVVIGVCFWPIRRNMRALRWGLVMALIALHLLMKAPVWFLIAHVDLVAGNSGYHRAALVDSFIRHFSDWWLIGTNQAVTWGYEMDDLANQFVAEGETGGLAGLICFILLISRSFGRIGDARKIVDGDPKQEWFIWLLGVAMFAHCVAFFGISYFDQTKVSWIALLVMIPVVTVPVLARETVPLAGTAGPLVRVRGPQVDSGAAPVAEQKERAAKSLQKANSKSLGFL